MAGVVLDGVTKVYPGGVVAVNQVDLEVRDREFLVLVGPSGCGKTTTLRMIAGLEAVSSGNIRIADRVVNGVRPKDRDIAMVFQNYALYPHMSVYNNIAFGLKLRYGGNWLKRVWWRWSDSAAAAQNAARRAEIPLRVRQTARALGIEDLLQRMPAELSGGERQRVALGRAIVRQPQAFLFDEPLSNLDARLRVEMRRQLKQLHRRLETTMIYVTHDQVEALTLGDRIAVIDRGQLQQVGPPLEVYRRPANRFVAGFLGTPTMNLVPGTLVQGTGPSDGLRFKTDAWTVAIDSQTAQPLKRQVNRPVVMGIRPEQLRIGTAQEGPPPGLQALGARVAMVEPLGDATVVHLEIGSQPAAQAGVSPVLVKAGGQTDLRPGQQVKVLLDVQHAHWFDAATGDRLEYSTRIGDH